MAWRNWFQIHNETVFNQRSPVVISRNPNQLDVFKIGFDNAVWTTFWNPANGWNAWFQIHPETVFDNANGHITAVSRNPEQIDLFTTGFDNAVWTTFWNPANGWNGWFQIHPETVFNQNTPVTVISRNPDQLDLFKIGFDGAVWTTFWNPANGWNGWFQIHPETVFDVNGTVTAIARNPNQIDLFVTGFDGAIWSTFWNPANGWNGWFQIHPETVFNQQAPIAALSRNPDQLDLFRIGFDGAVWTTFWNPANGWNGWFQLHPETRFDAGGIVTAISRNPDQIDLFTTGFDGAVWSSFWNPAIGWSTWFPIRPATVFNQLTSVACVARTPDHIDLFRIGFDNVLWSDWWERGQQYVKIYFKSLLRIDATIQTFIDTQFAGIEELYAEGAIDTVFGTVEDLSRMQNAATLSNFNVGNCILGQPTQDHNTLFPNRNGAGANDIVIYIVQTLIGGSGNFVGCATFPSGQPGCVIVQTNARWLAAHEVGHVLGLLHVCQPPATPCVAGNSDSLMFPNTGWTNLPPDISAGEFTTMLNSPFTVNY